MGLRYQLIETDAEFDHVKQIWLNFENETNNVNLNTAYFWQHNWWKIFKDYNNNKFGYNKKLKIVLVYREEKLIAILPLILVVRYVGLVPLSFLEFLSQQWSGIYFDIISYNLTTDITDAIFQWIRKNIRYDILHLNHIPEYSHTIQDKKYIHGFCPYINLTKYSDYMEYTKKQYSKNLRRNLTKGKNRAKRDNRKVETSVRKLTTNLFEEIVSLSKSKLETGKHSIYTNSLKKKFYEIIHKSQNAEITTIEINGQVVAYRTNIYYKGIKFEIDTSYNRAFTKYNLGILNLKKNIEYSFDSNLHIHCMGPGIDSYKIKYTTTVVELYRYICAGRTIKGQLLVPIFRLFLMRKQKKMIGNLQKTFTTH